ncbi:MAG TPA: hypothetical protein VFC41_09795, partial [Anaerovoracaceae bacterium]|nr:hypothetical protein [Anaerovoracaceae bacterium]
MKLKLNDKEYVSGTIKAVAFRKSIEIKEALDFDNLTTDNYNTIVDFTVEIFGGQFTRDEFWNGLDANKLLPTISQ